MASARIWNWIIKRFEFQLKQSLHSLLTQSSERSSQSNFSTLLLGVDRERERKIQIGFQIISSKLFESNSNSIANRVFMANCNSQWTIFDEYYSYPFCIQQSTGRLPIATASGCLRGTKSLTNVPLTANYAECYWLSTELSLDSTRFVWLFGRSEMLANDRLSVRECFNWLPCIFGRILCMCVDIVGSTNYLPEPVIGRNRFKFGIAFNWSAIGQKN